MTGRISVVTGASSGIGRATATALAANGGVVGVGYRADEAGAEATVLAVEAAGGKGVPFRLDLADPEGAAEAVVSVVELLGGIDAFVNNAGVNRRGAFLAENLDDWQRILTVDLTGPFAAAQAAARLMAAQGRGGRIVNVTSVHDAVPIEGGAAYCAAKGGLAALTKVMALELAPHGITVNTVSPGETATPMNGVPDDRDAATIARPAIPVGRPGRAAEVAALIAYLAGPDAGYTTGAAVTVDGGLTLTSAVPNAAYAGRL